MRRAGAADVKRRGVGASIAVASARGAGAPVRGLSKPGRFAISVGIVIAGTLLGALALTQLVMGRIPFGEVGALNDLRIATVHCLLVAYLSAAHLYLSATARRAVLALRPVLDLDGPSFDRLLEATGTIPRAHGALMGIIGLGVAYVGPYLSGSVPAQPWHPAEWSPEVAWHRVLGPVAGVWIGWFGYVVVRESSRLSSLAATLAPLDLMDLRGLAQFTRQGLNHALLTAGLLAVFGLFVVDQGFTPIIALMTPLMFALALASLLLPLRGVRDRISNAKSAELAWIDQSIRAHADTLRASQSGPAAGSLADLIAYRHLIERVREWPFDQSALARIALYLLIPIGSWLAGGLVGAVVERWLFGD